MTHGNTTNRHVKNTPEQENNPGKGHLKIQPVDHVQENHQ